MMGADAIQDLPRWGFGSGAILIAISVATSQSGNLPIVFASVFFILICTTDTLFSKIHNISTFTLALTGVAYQSWLTGPAGLVTALLGLATGFALLLLPCLLGGMGAGDVKSMAALGTLTGPTMILQVFLYIALLGGLISFVHLLCSPQLAHKIRGAKGSIRSFVYTRDISALKPGANPQRLRLPYAAAIALGYFAHLRWGNLI